MHAEGFPPRRKNRSREGGGTRVDDRLPPPVQPKQGGACCLSIHSDRPFSKSNKEYKRMKVKNAFKALSLLVILGLLLAACAPASSARLCSLRASAATARCSSDGGSFARAVTSRATQPSTAGALRAATPTFSRILSWLRPAPVGDGRLNALRALACAEIAFADISLRQPVRCGLQHPPFRECDFQSRAPVPGAP